MPTKGMTMTFFTLIFLRMNINKNVPPKAKIKAIPILPITGNPGRKIMDTRMPNLAESIVAAVLGETNLFLVICCMISPDILSAIPVMRMLISLGILLNINTRTSVSPPLIKS